MLFFKFIYHVKNVIILYRMISQKRESENLINDKFMKKIQSTTTNYELRTPDTYEDVTIEKPTKESEIEKPNYRYLDDDPLHKIIESGENAEFHYVLYNIVDDTVLPFIKFLMCNDDNIFKFPNHKSDIENINETSSIEDTESESDDIIPYEDNDDSDDDIEITNLSGGNLENDDDIYFSEQCSQYLEKTFNIDFETSNSLYKGYVKVEDRLYVFIDISIINVEIPESDVFSWVIIDEIVNKRLCNNIPICNMIVDLFSTNQVIKNIYNENNEPIETPIQVYICENDENNYINIESRPIINMSLLTPKVQHSIFGNTSLFSREGILNDEKQYERYCLFTKEAVYVLYGNFTKSDISMIDNKSCIRFPYNGLEYWSVKDLSLYSPI